MSFHYPLYAIWAEAAENGPLSGKCGYLTERGDVPLYGEKEAAELKMRDIRSLCVNKSPAAAYTVCELREPCNFIQCLPLEAIKKYDLIPDFEPTAYELMDKVFGNTGGGCMVGTVKVRLPDLDKTVWANCDEGGVTVTSADCIWNGDQSGSWERWEDVLLFTADFRTMRPEEAGAWLPIVYEALAYTVEQQTARYGGSLSLPAEWLPDTCMKNAGPNYLAWALSNGEDVTISPDGQIALSESYLRERRQSASEKMLVYVASPYAGDIQYNTEFAKQACRAVMESGHAFFAPHLLYPAILDDAQPEQRQLGMEMGLSVLSRCDELWAFGDTVSKGMQAEIDAAESMGIPVKYMTLSMEQELSGPELQASC